MNDKETLFHAIGDVGDDLIHMAETRTFHSSPWRRWASLAACLALVLCVSAIALPYFPKGCGAAQETAAPPAAESVQNSKPESAAESTTSKKESAAEDYFADLPQESAVNAPAEETLPKEDSLTQATLVGKAIDALGWLSYRDVVYYGWGYYTEEAAMPQITQRMEDTTQASGVADWSRRMVYEKTAGEHGAPDEIYVETQNGLLHCTTWHQPADAFINYHDAQAMIENGTDEALLTTFAQTFEMNFSGQYYLSPKELRAEQLQQMYLLFLTLERQFGTRTYEADKDAWYMEEENAFVIPMDDICRTLSCYLDGYDLDVSQLPNFDWEREALVLPDVRIGLEESAWPYRLSLLDAVFVDDTTMVLAVGSYTEDYKTQNHITLYDIRFADGHCYFDSIMPELPVEEPEAESALEDAAAP